MIYPFRPHNEFESVVEQFQESCNMIAPFYITLSEFRFFHHRRENYTIWLAPMPKEPIMQLQTKLWELVPDCDDVRKHKNEFTPHLSVGQIRGHTNMRHVRDSLQTQWQPLTFSVQEISLIWRGHPPNDVFQIGKTIRLSSSRL
jgi:2'-5' RNA ligase